MSNVLNLDAPVMTLISNSSHLLTPERRYGCYRLGIVFAVAIILVLLAGTVLPSVLVVSNRQLLLIATCCTLIVVAVLIFVYTCCQHRTARKQRQLCDRGDASTTSNRRFATITSIGSPIMMPSSTSTDRTVHIGMESN